MPMDVILDSVYLKTLSKEEYLNGYAEIIKHSFLTDLSDLSFHSLIKLDFFNDVDFIISKYSDIKNQIVKTDKYESNSRKVLNLGHTIGHALESYSHLSNSLDKLKHGEAIIIGLITELYISNKLNDFSIDTVDKLKEVSLNYFSKISLIDNDLKGIYDLMIFDKKNDKGSINFVLLDKAGNPMIDQKIDYDIFIEAFAYYNN